MAHQGPSLLAFATPTHPHVPVPLLLVDSVVSQDPLVFLANTSVFDSGSCCFDMENILCGGEPDC